MSISVAQLKRIAPTCKQSMLEALAPAMTENFPKYGVTTRLRVVHFLAQLEHESGDFRYTEEIWGNTPAQQRYDIRPDLGNTPQRDGDGKLYKGHGLIQTTGKHNHEVVTKRLRAKGYNCPDFVKEPAKLAEMPWALLSALEFWDEHSLNALADRDDIDAITKKVNGGTNGLADRKKQLAEAKAVFTSDPFPAGEKPAPAAPVSPAAPSAPTSQVLRKGDKGEAVRQFQAQLVNLGYAVKIDGDFGPGTEAIVKGFQRGLAMKADGVVGPATMAAINAKLSLSKPAAPAAAPAATDQPKQSLLGSVLSAVGLGKK